MTLPLESNKQLLQQRLRLFYLPIVVVFIVLAARFWQLQIVHGNEYALRAERNRVRNIQLAAPRGTILDRNGRPLVENRPSFNILLYRESIKNPQDTADFIIDNLKVSADNLDVILRRSKSTGLYHPVVIKEDVGIDDISIVEAHRRDHPEVQLGPEPRRLYRYGKLAAHVLGYVGEVNDEELTREQFPGARVGSLVGKSGVERVYNQSVVGQDGRRRVMVDSVGREVGLLEEDNAIMGGELRVTLDVDLQLAAESALMNKVGAIIAMDPRNGEILALASAPSFDPNSFSARISEADWNRLIEDPDHPLQDRAIQNGYSPGSIFKLIMSDAGLEEGLIDEDTHVFCRGSEVFYNRLFHCASKGGHGNVTLETAIAKSCNIFFYDLGRRMGIDRIAEHAHALGLGEKTGVDLPGEHAGVMPSPEWKQQTRKAKWFAGETISVSIGQGAVSTTPLQILRAVSAIATNGKLTTPHVFLNAERLPSVRWPERLVPIGEERARRIRSGMWASVNDSGTGHNAAISGLDICGKTGTVQVMSNETRKEARGDLSDFEDHSWFAGFASRDNPEIAVVVFIEHGGKGGIAAAPLARELFRTYYARHQHPELFSALQDSQNTRVR